MSLPGLESFTHFRHSIHTPQPPSTIPLGDTYIRPKRSVVHQPSTRNPATRLGPPRRTTATHRKTQAGAIQRQAKCTDSTDRFTRAFDIDPLSLHPDYHCALFLSARRPAPCRRKTLPLIDPSRPTCPSSPGPLSQRRFHLALLHLRH